MKKVTEKTKETKFLKIKQEYRNLTKMIKTKNDITIFFDGTRQYTQAQLEKFQTNEYFKEFVTDKEDANPDKIETLTLTYVNTKKQIPLEEQLEILGDALGDKTETEEVKTETKVDKPKVTKAKAKVTKAKTKK